MRLIDSDALLLKKYGEGETDSYEVVDVDDILDAPTVDAEPVRHAFWEADVWSRAEKHVIKTVPLTEENRRKYAFRKPFDIYLTNEHCSACKQNPLANFNEEYEFSDYCPHCGAKMDAEEVEG